MLLQASFDELNHIIGEKAPVKGLTLSYHSADTATVSLFMNLMGFFSPSVSAKIRVVSIEGRRLSVELDAGSLGGFMLDKARKLLLEKAPAGLVETFDGKYAVLNLDAIPQLKSTFERIDVRSISFTREAVCLDASLK